MTDGLPSSRGTESTASRRRADPWFFRPSPRPDARVRLFCFPYAGAGASVYRAWPDHVPAAVEICAVQPPGREGRLWEKPFARVQDLAEAAVEALRPHIDRPYALFGHSLGALVAFEATRFLAARNRPLPIHLFVSGQGAPHLPQRQPPIAHLPHDSFVTEVLRRYEGIPEEVLNTPELMELLVPTLRADMAAVEGHRHVAGPPLGCPITAYGGSEDPEATEVEIAAWQEHSNVAFRHVVLPGRHFFLRTSLALLAADVVMSMTSQAQDGDRR